MVRTEELTITRKMLNIGNRQLFALFKKSSNFRIGPGGKTLKPPSYLSTLTGAILLPRDLEKMIELREAELTYEGNSYQIVYQKAIPCEIHERWEQIKRPHRNPSVPKKRVSGLGNPQLLQQKVGQYGMVSGFYENFPSGDGRQAAHDGNIMAAPQTSQCSDQGGDPNIPGMPGQQQFAQGGNAFPLQPGYSYPFYGGPQTSDPNQQNCPGDQGHHNIPPGMQNIPPGQHNFPPQGFPPGLPPGMMLVKDPNTGVVFVVPAPGYPNPQDQTDTDGRPNMPPGPPPPYMQNLTEKKAPAYSKNVEVERYEPETEEPIDPCTVLVSGPEAVLTDLDTLEYYFESTKRSGGGDIADIKYDEDLNAVKIKFEEEEEMATPDEIDRKSITLSRGSDEDYSLVCLPCHRDESTIPAFGYCIDCNEHLCHNCYKHHKKATLSRHHKLQDKYTMPSTQQLTDTSVHAGLTDNLTTACPRHKAEMIKLYCHDHSLLLCSICVALEHTKPCHVDYIPDISNQMKYKREYRDTMDGMDKLVKECTAVETKTSLDNDKSDDSLKNALVDVKKYRQGINKRIDELQKKIENKIHTQHHKNGEKMKTVETICDDVKKVIKVIYDSMKQLSTSKQASKLFIELKQAKAQLQDYENSIASVSAKDSIDEYKFIPCQAINDVLQKEKMIGYISKRLHYRFF